MKKLLFVLLGAFILFTTVACAPKTYEEKKALYDDIISQYTAYLTAKYNGEELVAPSTKGMNRQEAAIAKTLYEIVDLCSDAQAAEALGYGFQDVDQDGTPELFLMSRYNTIRAIFTVSGNAPILLEANYGKGTSFFFASDNRFLLMRDTVTDNMEQTLFDTCHVSGDQMVYEASYGSLYDMEKKEVVERFQIVDGTRTPIDEETFDELHFEQAKTQSAGYENVAKLFAPRIFLPLTHSATSDELPIADFSSYAAIIKTHMAISACVDQFDTGRWRSGAYDDLFAFPSDLSYQYYNRLLYAAYGAQGDAFGYDELDLNGDGHSELVIMNENYCINAIFTQKDGHPVLLAAFASTTCWLDDQGRIHADRYLYDEQEYSIYEFKEDGSYHPIYSLSAKNVSSFESMMYLTKDGNMERLPTAASWYVHYDAYHDQYKPFCATEMTRNVSSLTYTPLTEPAQDPLTDAIGKTWQRSAKLAEKINGYQTNGNTYVSFENVTDTQMDVHIEYDFFYYYPDPERENYALEGKTESFLDISAHKENGVFVFDAEGLGGRLEFGHEYLWLVVEESTDERFPVGHYCFSEYTPMEYLP